MKLQTQIVPFGYPILRETCKPVKLFDKSLVKLVETMKKALYQHGDGAALAAPQIAVSKQVIVMDYEGEYLELINPEILSKSSEMVTASEGCLSLPGFFGNVERHQSVEVTFWDRQGNQHTIERFDEIARCLQHEMDHLKGILFVDRMTEEFLTNGTQTVSRFLYSRELGSAE